VNTLSAKKTSEAAETDTKDLKNKGSFASNILSRGISAYKLMARAIAAVRNIARKAL